MVITLDDPMPFGKHKGDPARTVAEYHYNYILWCARNLDVKFSDKVMHIAKTEKKQAMGREMAYAYCLPCRRPNNNWSKLKEDQPTPKMKPELPETDEEFEDEELQDGFDVVEPDEYAGMDYSDFGNN